MSNGDPPSTQATEQQISQEILRVHQESYGVGADAITTHLLDDLVVVMIDVEVTTAEQTLIEAGQLGAVKETREAFQEAIAPTFKAIVEHATGRKVASFVSHMNVEPLFSVELFRLRPPTRYSTA
jgi:uncharacterized protein YbcI